MMQSVGRLMNTKCSSLKVRDLYLNKKIIYIKMLICPHFNKKQQCKEISFLPWIYTIQIDLQA